MTSTDTLRAALEKHGITYGDNDHGGFIDDDWDRCLAAILEAMEQHRREGLEEVEKWFDNFINTSSPDDPFDALMEELPKFLTALKTPLQNPNLVDGKV